MSTEPVPVASGWTPDPDGLFGLGFGEVDPQLGVALGQRRIPESLELDTPEPGGGAQLELMADSSHGLENEFMAGAQPPHPNPDMSAASSAPRSTPVCPPETILFKVTDGATVLIR